MWDENLEQHELEDDRDGFLRIFAAAMVLVAVIFLPWVAAAWLARAWWELLGVFF